MLAPERQHLSQNLLRNTEDNAPARARAPDAMRNTHKKY